MPWPLAPWHLFSVPEIRIPITDELATELMSRRVDAVAVCLTALRESLDKTGNSCTTSEPMQKTKERAKPGPKASIEKAGVGIYLPTDLLEWLRSQQRNPKDLSNVVLDLLQKARSAGWSAFSSDGPVKKP